MHRSHSGLLCRSKLHPDCRHGMKHKRLSVLCLLNETKVKSCLEIQLDFILKHDLCFLGWQMKFPVVKHRSDKVFFNFFFFTSHLLDSREWKRNSAALTSCSPQILKVFYLWTKRCTMTQICDRVSVSRLFLKYGWLFQPDPSHAGV